MIILQIYRPIWVLIFCALGLPVTAQDTVLGKWRTLDDNTGETKAIVEIFEKDGKVYGKILKLFPKPGDDPDPVCDKCSTSDPRYKKKIIGMEILHDMVQANQEYTNGNILDPESGKVYRCKIWIEDTELKVRGFLGPFWRTQTWKRVT